MFPKACLSAANNRSQGSSLPFICCPSLFTYALDGKTVIWFSAFRSSHQSTLGANRLGQPESLWNVPLSRPGMRLRFSSARGQGESSGPYLGHWVTEGWHWWPEGGSSYSPGAVDADYSLSPPKTVCACWKATSSDRWPCCAEHSGSKGVNLDRQSLILRCECRA